MVVTNLIRFPDRRRRREQAAAWMARLDRGLTDTEGKDLNLWLTDPANRETLIEFGGFWDEMSCLTELAQLFPLERSAFRDRPATRRYQPLAIGVAFAACLAAGVWLVAPAMRTGPAPHTVARTEPYNQTFRTAIGEHTAVTLTDGSTVALNTNTVLEVRFATTERAVFLRRGEAFFTVAHDATRPFRVQAGAQLMQAVGTAFNVRLHDDDSVEVTVAEGKVSVHPAAARNINAPATPGRSGAATLVSANEALTVTAAAPEVKPIDPVDLDVKLAWQRGMLIFRGDPLAAVLDEVSRYAPVDFVLENDTLGALRVGGYFRVGDIDALLVALNQNFHINATREGDNRILLSAR